MSETETSDLLGLSAPLTKLIETASAGLGRLYEPWHIRRMAKARAEEINTMGEAIRKNPELPIKYEDGKLLLDGTDCTELAQRAQQRFVFQELKKQQNLDNIVINAAKNLNETESVDPKPVDEEWISHFFDAAAHVSNEEMQQLWGKILAGEVSHPGSTSLRTLNILKTISQQEAELFSRYLPFVLYDGANTFIWDESEVFDAFSNGFTEQLLLEECGLLAASPETVITYEISDTEQEKIFTDKCDILMKGTSQDKRTFDIGVIFLTKAGQELSKILPHETNLEYKLEIVRHLSFEAEVEIIPHDK